MAKFNWFDDVVDEQLEKAGRATWRAAESILTESNKKVPHDTGTLERSGVVTQDGLSGMPKTIYNQAKNDQWPKNNFKFDFRKKPIFYISYNTPYAVETHEVSKNYRNGRESKWLETTSKTMSGKIEGWIKEEMKKG